MNLYNVIINFKNKEHKPLEIKLESNENIRDKIVGALGSIENRILYIADYVIDANEILYIEIKGEGIEKRSRKKLSNTRT